MSAFQLLDAADNHLCIYLQLESLMFTLEEDDFLAEIIRDRLDLIWNQLTSMEKERLSARGMIERSADLYRGLEEFSE